MFKIGACGFLFAFVVYVVFQVLGFCVFGDDFFSPCLSRHCFSFQKGSYRSLETMSWVDVRVSGCVREVEGF